MKSKTAQETETLLSVVMMPIHANHYGSVHGGTILHIVDEAALVAASKHARKNVVLASMDHIVFEHPVCIGDLLHTKARLCYVGQSSMEVEVKIDAEKLKGGPLRRIGSAYLTMVAVDEKGRPTAVPGLILKTKEERMKAKQALARRKARLSR